MPRDVEANELTNVEVEFISLVPNAASRLPFRLTKEEAAMKQETDAVGAEGAEGDAKTESEAEAESDTAVRTRLEEGLAALTASLDALNRLIIDFETRLSAAEVQVKKTEHKLSGTVPGTPVGDPDEPVAVRKSIGEPPLMDTGMGFYA